jgi:hypothetical protein
MFFIKLKADIYRYMAENSDPGEEYNYLPSSIDHVQDETARSQIDGSKPLPTKGIQQSFFIEEAYTLYEQGKYIKQY